jgi:hypothetical protein
MTITKQLTTSVTGGAVTIQNTVTRTADGTIDIKPAVNTAKALGAWVKGEGAGDATATLTAGHLWSTGVGDVYWTGGRRYNVTVTIDTNAVTLAAGTGDAYPATADATVVLAMHKRVNCTIDGDLLQLISFCFQSTTTTSTARGHVHAEDAAGDTIADIDFDANEPRTWDFGTGVATNDDGRDNPFTGDIITTLDITMDSTSETVTMAVTGLQDVTP